MKPGSRRRIVGTIEMAEAIREVVGLCAERDVVLGAGGRIAYRDRSGDYVLIEDLRLMQD